MKARDIMVMNVITVSPEASVREVATHEIRGTDSVCWPTGNVLVPTQESTTDMSFFKFHCVLTGGPPGRRY